MLTHLYLLILCGIRRCNRDQMNRKFVVLLFSNSIFQVLAFLFIYIFLWSAKPVTTYHARAKPVRKITLLKYCSPHLFVCFPSQVLLAKSHTCKTDQKVSSCQRSVSQPQQCKYWHMWHRLTNVWKVSENRLTVSFSTKGASASQDRMKVN